MTFNNIITDSLNKKRSFNDNFVKDIKPSKRLKGDSDDGNDQYIHNIPKQIYVSIEKSLVTYSSLSDRNIKLSKLILDKNVSEKIDCKITLPYITSIIEKMAKGKANTLINVDQVKSTIGDDHNILKVLFVKRVKNFETIVGHFVFEYLKSMKIS